jgi:hypothetical protein
MADTHFSGLDTPVLKLGGTAVTATATEINKLASMTSSKAELNKLTAVTTTAAELNKLSGVTTTAAELNKLSGVTTTAAELNILTGVTATAAELNTIDLSVVGAAVKMRRIPITAAANTNENDTTFDIPDKSIVIDVILDVTTAEATASTKTVDIGLLSSESGGVADGFADGISTANIGLIRPEVTVTTGGSETYFSATTRGSFLQNFFAGANADGDSGVAHNKPHLSTAVTAKSVSWTAGEAQTEFVGAILIFYIEIA